MSLSTRLEPLLAHWRRWPSREKNALKIAVGLVLVLALWTLSVAPSLATLRRADAQAKTLATELQQVKAMQTEAQALQTQPVLSFDEAVRALTTNTQQTFGASAQFKLAGEQASVTLKDVPADALAQWLVQARLNARSVPLEAQLVRGSASAGGPSWSGVLTMGLPAR
ncbi:hypothetical protein AwPolaro_04450 [Polaromonas sp.]|nr:hypothetical protein AwPolaro_04450 [Polaromonas sp.]